MSGKESKTDSVQEAEYKRYELPRTGKTNLVFNGILLAEASNHDLANGPHQDRWDEYALYHTRGGSYVLYHEFVTRWQGEHGMCEAWTGSDPVTVLAMADYVDADGCTQTPGLIVEIAEKAGIDISEHIE